MYSIIILKRGKEQRERESKGEIRKGREREYTGNEVSENRVWPKQPRAGGE